MWTQSEAICGALQLCDEQSGMEGDGVGARGACGLTNEYPGGFFLIVGEEWKYDGANNIQAFFYVWQFPPSPSEH